MDTSDLLFAQTLEAATSPLESQSQILSGFILFIRLQRDGMVALLAITQGLEPPAERRLTEQEHMRPGLRGARRQTQKSLHRSTGQLLGVIHQQVDFLARQRQLDHLRHHAVKIGVLAVQGLGDLRQQRARVHRSLRGNDHALNRLLVATGNQRLTQQGFATSLRPRH